MPLPNDGEVKCGACRRALNRSDVNCYACGSTRLDRSALQKQTTPGPLISPGLIRALAGMPIAITDENCWVIDYTQDGSRLCPAHQKMSWQAIKVNPPFAFKGTECTACDRRIGPNGWEPR